jgi:3-hydroxybutyrate dehydrogenase
VYTPLVENQIQATAQARGITPEEVITTVMLGSQPTREFVPAQDIAALVAFLASPSGKAVTGACWTIDGGWTAH